MGTLTFLIETAELHRLLEQQAPLQLLDVTAGPVKADAEEQPAGKAWLQAHLPGSRWLDQQLLKDPASPYPYVAPAAAAVLQVLEQLGLRDDVPLVLYSASGYGWATRVWLLLYSLGFTQVRVLNGGLQKWRAEGRPLQQGGTPWPQLPRSNLGQRTQQHPVYADLERVRRGVEQQDAQIVDALSPDQYLGKVPGKYGRSGHLAGALNLPGQSLVNPADNTFKPIATLRDLLTTAGIRPDQPLIAYCGGGIAASILAFAALQAGWHDVQVYQASLAEWAPRPELPMEPGTPS